MVKEKIFTKNLEDGITILKLQKYDNKFANISKKDLKKGRVYLRNKLSAKMNTAITPYAAGAPAE